MSDYDSIQRIENMNVTSSSDRIIWYAGADSERPTRVASGSRKSNKMNQDPWKSWSASGGRFEKNPDRPQAYPEENLGKFGKSLSQISG